MNIAAMNVRITIQKQKTTEDDVGNHKNSWHDYLSCWATPVHAGGSESEDAGTVNATDRIDFTIRYTKKLDGVDASKIRVMLGKTIYNVTDIDPMGFRKKSLKLKCQKVRR